MISIPREDRLEQFGVRVTAGGDQPFLLTGPYAWVVESGFVDVFAIAVDPTGATGNRNHLFRVTVGGALFAVSDGAQPVELLAVSSGNAVVRRVTRAQLRAAAAADFPADVSGLLDGWVDRLCATLARDALSDAIRALPPDGTHDAATVERVRPGASVTWVRQERGESRFLGRTDASLSDGDVLPLSSRSWLEMQPDSRIGLEDTATALGAGHVWPGLDRLHGLLLQFAAALRTADHDRARNRLHAKATTSRNTYDGAWTRLTMMLRQSRVPHLDMGPRIALPKNGRAESVDLVAACRLVAQANGVRLRVPPASVQPLDRTSLLAALGRASRFRMRPVTLRDAWWASDAGPLLAFSREGGRAVALLPLARGIGYEQVSPAGGGRVRVDAAMAGRLQPWAYTFYRPFDAGQLSLGNLVRFAGRGVRRDLTLVLLMGIGTGLLSLLTPITTAIVFNDIVPGANRAALAQATVLLVVFAVVAMMMKFAGDVALLRVDSKIGAAMLSAMWDRLLSLPVPFFRQFSAGSLATRTNALEQARNIVSGTTIGALLAGSFSLFHFGLLVHYSAHLAFVGAAMLGVAVLVSATCGVLQRRDQRRIATSQSTLAGTVLQLLSSIAKLRMAGAEVHAFAIWARGFSQQREFQFKVRVVGDVLLTFNTMFPLLASMVLFVIGLPIVKSGAMRTGDFLAFMTSFAMASTGVLAATSALLSVMTATAYYEQARPILLASPEVDVDKIDPGPLSGQIELQNVTFRYGADAPAVLNDVSLTFPAGEFVALVGPSGTGKSTLFRLLLGFEQPMSGGIYYDRQDLSGLDVRAVRGQIGVVLQQAQLIPGDIYTNIVGSAAATLDEAWEAARAAGLDEEIQRMPMGMNTVVGEGSGGMSGGQRQRLMIARALVRRPRMLFFDEATSALDNRTQGLVSRSLAQMHITRVVIAHRLSTIEQADRIYVLNKSRVEQMGTFTELLKMPGLFADLARRQIA